MSQNNKNALIKLSVKAVMYCISVAGLFLLTDSILDGDSITITVNWVQFMWGAVLLCAVINAYWWLFKRVIIRKVSKDEQ